MAATNATGCQVWRYTSTWQLMGTTAGASYIDNDVLPETTYQYYLIAINPAGSSSPSAIITVTTPPSIWIDLDIDSFNTSRFAAPSRTQAEDDIEDDPNHFGKIMQPNYGDADGDGVLDIWDGYNGSGQFQSGTNCSEKFVPIVIEIPQGINLANATFQFDFWSGSTTMTGYSPASPPRFGDGNIRIWTKDGDQPRSASDVKQYGNLVMDGTSYTAQNLGFTDSSGNLLTNTITLYVEGHMLSSTPGNREIIVSMDYAYNGENIHVEDKVKYTVQEEAAWWIESVEWVKNSNGNELVNTRTGISVYADKDAPNATNDYRNVNVIVTIGGVVPTGGGTMTLVCIDPENASVPRATGKEDTPDNYDGIDIFNGAKTISVKFTHGGPVTQTVTVTVGIHAGDNYNVLAIPSSGKPYAESETLTVWRRLWVECDAMPYYPETTNTGTVITPPNPASYLDLATSELAHACVTPVVYTPNTHQPTVGHNPMTDEDMLRLLGAKKNPQTGIREPDPLTQPDGRDLYGNSSEFWTVRIVMISQYGTAAGSVLLGFNTIVVRYEAIKDAVGSWNVNHSAESVSVNAYISRNILHEICHLLTDRKNDTYVYFSAKDTTTTDKSTIGIRDAIWRTLPGKPDESEPDMYNRILYNTLLVGNIREIQQYSRAQD